MIATPDAPALALEHVDKMYKGRVHALRGITMEVRRGEVFGLLGPNGAGKSTLVKILMTVVKPTSCRGAILGERVGSKGVLARVGYLPEHHKFPDYLTGRQILDFAGAMAGVAKRERDARARELLDLVQMTKWAHKRVGGYSKGMRQRIGIAQSLVNDPDLVLLDEPSDGVDPVGRREIRGMIAELKRRGKTVFLNSHLLSELEMVCDRVAIMVQGRVKQQGTIEELTRDGQHVEIALDGSPLDAIRPALDALGAARSDETESAGRYYGVDPEQAQSLLAAAREQGVQVSRFVAAARPSLEDLFMAAVVDEDGKELGPGAVDRTQDKTRAQVPAPKGASS